ncbi:BLUF domain-containing protein [Salinimicrobium oceani]|uniref:BLUF domain-containing protein n=1 Tax=Salinimicrobium oceani TaxID=2722702 RepID=A0ABX1CW10_9FLAO|nr:BLUF domain-containing protein [Salinimicrobium oceani]NJW51937.1 BLUF domain-containing protein [Salinimicrobium oceani]
MKYSLCYVSTVEQDVSQETIEQILKESSINNNRDRITGILLFSNGNFFQVLEGKKEKVEQLYQRIARDPRHYNLICIFKKKIPFSRFEQYENEFLSLDATYSSNDLHLYAAQIEKLDPEIQKSVTYILSNFC